MPTFAPLKDGAIAQLVEQRTENPCVPGSIPGGTTFKRENVPVRECGDIFLLKGEVRAARSVTTLSQNVTTGGT